MTHYELFVRRRPADDWVLDHVGEDRATVLEEAQERLGAQRCAGVRVVKECYEPDTGRFQSVTVMEQGLAAVRKPAEARPAPSGPPCARPEDLYLPAARERLGRLLEPFLARHQCTPWELLHRPDLAEVLERSGGELRGAVQRAAIEEAQARGGSTHEALRTLQALADAALTRLVRDGRRGLFPEIDPSNFAVTAGRLCDHAQGAYLLGGGVAAFLAQAPGGSERLARLADLLDSAPRIGPSHSFVARVVEPLLMEMLGGGVPLDRLFREAPDAGGRLTAIVRLSASAELALLEDAGAPAPLPPVEGAAGRLAPLLATPAFDRVRGAAVAFVLRELKGPRRLRPGDPDAEIELLRALAAVLSAMAGPLVSREEVQASFIACSRRMVSADFVALHLKDRGGALHEARAMVRLCENLTGALNRRQGARWLMGVLQSLRFETEVRSGAETPSARLAQLAALQRGVCAAALPEPEAAAAAARIGEAGGWVEAEARLVEGVVRSAAGLLSRTAALLRLAAGETAPLGPAADKARTEAARILRLPEVHGQLAARPELLELARQAAGGGRAA